MLTGIIFEEHFNVGLHLGLHDLFVLLGPVLRLEALPRQVAHQEIDQHVAYS